MTKDNWLSDELFIVLTLPEKDVSPLTQLQKKVASDYDLFPEGKYPELHITLNKVEHQAVQPTTDIIKQTAASALPIRIQVNDFTCFDNNFLVINVEETDSLLNLAARLHSQLNRHNLSTIEDYYQNWKFHITLISDLLSNNSIPHPDFKQMCTILDGIQQPISTYAKAIEFWRPTLNPEKKVIASFPLIGG